MDTTKDTKAMPRRNDALQSGADDEAFGQDARSFGEGGQTIERAFDPVDNDKPDRDPERDESLPRGEHPSRSKTSAGIMTSRSER